MAEIFSKLKPIPEATLSEGATLDDHIAQKQPFIVRGLIKDWPLVKAGLESGKAARQYLLDRQKDRKFVVSYGPPSKTGRIFYDDDMSINVKTGQAKLKDAFDRIDLTENDAEQPTLYLASIDMGAFFNGLNTENTVDLGDRKCMESIWIGTRTRIAAHNDFPDNLACVAVGRRRFTVFPPDQFRNLYLGPVDNTPAGRAISMVDFHKPDTGMHPKFEHAIEAGMTATLEPGDAIFIPSMWWHHIEALEPFNALINYWWRETPRYLGQPQNALNHAMMTIRDLPEIEKKHWQDLFNYYVFENTSDVTDHLPEFGYSVLGPMTAEQSSKIRNFLLRALGQ